MNKHSLNAKYEEKLIKSRGYVMPRLMEFSPKYGLMRGGRKYP